MKCLIEELVDTDVLPWGWVMLRRTPNTDAADGFIEVRMTGDVDLIAENAAAFELLDVYEKENERLRLLLSEAHNQIEYLGDKFQETGSGNATLSRIADALKGGNDE